MFKPTPGPWEYVPSNEHHGPYVAGPHGGDICDCYAMSNPASLSIRNGGDSKPVHFQHEHADDNARLIASAPDLLKALDEAEDLLGFHEGSAEKMTETGHLVVWVNNEDLERVLKSIREAIAKAKGGAS